MSRRRIKLDIRQAGRHVLLVLGLLFAVDAAGYVFGVRPVVRQLQQLRDTNGPQLAELAARRESVESREKFLADVVQLERDLKWLREEKLSTRMARMVQVQLELHDLARQFGIDLNSVSYQNDLLPAEQVDRLAMNVPLQGGYANLRRFLQAVEGSDKFLVVERVALATGKEGGRLLELNITLATYFFAAREGAAAPSGARSG